MLFNASLKVLGTIKSKLNHFQEPVLDIQVDATLDPGASPATGARYILENVAALHANFGTITGVGNDDIVEYNGSAFEIAFDASGAGEGAICWVSDVNGLYDFDGAAWNAPTSTDEKVKVSSNDTTEKYLEDSIVVAAGSNSSAILELSTLNDGANEDLQIQIDEAKINHDNLLGFVGDEHIDHSGVSVLAALGGLQATNNDLTSNIGLSVKLEADAGIEIDGTNGGLELKLNSTALTKDASGLAVATDGEGIQVGASGLELELDGSTLSKAAGGIKASISGLLQRTFVATWIPGDGATKVVNHAFATDNVIVEIYDINKESIFVDSIDRNDTNNVTLTASEAPAANYTVIVKEAAATSGL